MDGERDMCITDRWQTYIMEEYEYARWLDKEYCVVNEEIEPSASMIGGCEMDIFETADKAQRLADNAHEIAEIQKIISDYK